MKLELHGLTEVPLGRARPPIGGLGSKELRRKEVLLCLLVSLSALTECDDATGPVERREERIGIVDHYGESEGVIVAPETVPLAVAFEILVRTYGGGCTSMGPTEVENTEDGVLITPIDITIVPGEGFACPQILRRIDHRVTLEFNEPGPFRITVRGRKLSAQDLESGGEIILVEHVVKVTP